jgi:hypothetical protein
MAVNAIRNKGMDLDRKRRNIIFIVSIFVIVHFAVSIRAGTKIGDVSFKLLEDRSRIPTNVRKDPEKLQQWLEKELRATNGFWYVAFHLTQDYPVGWILAPQSKKIQQKIRNAYQDGRFSRAEVAARMGALFWSTAGINSILAGCCLGGGVALVRKIRNKT